MSGLEELTRALGAPESPRYPDGGDWSEVEAYVGSALPGDFKAFLDTFGTGAICDELVVFHPQGSAPLLPRMREQNEYFAAWRARDADSFPYPFHPEPGGLISWGYDHGGDEHFFLPCDADPDRWKIATLTDGEGIAVFDGPFATFVVDFIGRLRVPLDDDELPDEEPDEADEYWDTKPATPSFQPF
jgi:hypothetical protein